MATDLHDDDIPGYGLIRLDSRDSLEWNGVRFVPELRWTRDKPVVTDWIKAGKSDQYWHRNSDSDNDPEVLPVYQGSDGRLYAGFDWGAMLVDDMPGEWAGPIPLPAEPAEAPK